MPHKKNLDQTISEPSTGKKVRETIREKHDREVAHRLQTELDNDTSTASRARATSSNAYEQAKAPSVSTNSIKSYPEPVNEALQELHDWAKDVIASKCYKCRTPLLEDFAVDLWFRGWIEKSNSSRTFSVCAAQCPKESCKVMTCVGCGQEPRTKRYTATCNGMRLDWCCQHGRLFAFWVALCKYDEAELQ